MPVAAWLSWTSRCCCSAVPFPALKGSEPQLALVPLMEGQELFPPGGDACVDIAFKRWKQGVSEWIVALGGDHPPWNCHRTASLVKVLPRRYCEADHVCVQHQLPYDAAVVLSRSFIMNKDQKGSTVDAPYYFAVVILYYCVVVLF